MISLPLKIARKWRGSFPMTTLTWTGAPLYFWSILTAWKALAAISSLVAWRPWSKKKRRSLHIEGACQFSRSRRKWRMRKHGLVWHWPATCRVCTAAGLLFYMNTAPSSSLLHKTAHRILGLLQPVPNSQCATPDTGKQQLKQHATMQLKSEKYLHCVCLYSLIPAYVFPP